MPITGKVKTLFSDSSKAEALFPRTLLKAVSDDNEISLAEILDNKQEKSKTTSITLSSANWSNNIQTVNIESVTQNSIILPAPAPESYIAYCEAGIYCSAQADKTLTFTCTDAPSVNLTVNVLIMS